ncbi:LacI family DNA-binding transcriptional regulator [Deinococcus knuensis]|uniref:LacI family transcriptional regulator n=1 Tax=Deinococcus knuensis TaxID=1837380 RepID=A0ABQ2SFW7_9DEIO|nr:LacI family DNA-binding transcriptional regulator [Deinococcus knuensis]GGS21768.1 LacI family transcriptional regulator [Deinococcus knuensis]
MTVSNVINNKPNVRPQTRARVLAAIEATGYQVNPLARALAGGRARVLSVLTRQQNLPYVTEVLMGAAQTAEELGYDLIVLMAGSRTDSDLSPMARLSAGTLLIQPPPDVRARYPHLPAHLVSVDGPSDRPLTVDNASGALAATRYLIGLGHTRIAFISGMDAHARRLAGAPHGTPGVGEDAPQRLNAYLHAMQQAGLDVPAGYVQSGDYSKRSGEDATRRLLALPDPPTAIFASGDAMAVGAVHTLQNLGLQVPEDLSVIGFDDLPMAAQARPALTTVRQPLREMGAEGVRLLVRLAEGEALPGGPPAPFPTELIVRASAAPPGR